MNKTETQTQAPQRGAKVALCVCKHDGQDQLHGAGMRVKNPCKGTDGKGAYRCTVCSKEN